MTDETLVRQFRERDESAITASKERYGAYCLCIARNILEDVRDAEECLNEALLAAWNSIPPQNPQNLKTYLGKLMREIAVDRFRKNSAKKRAPSASLLCLDELDSLIGESRVEASAEEAELAQTLPCALPPEACPYDENCIILFFTKGAFSQLSFDPDPDGAEWIFDSAFPFSSDEETFGKNE